MHPEEARATAQGYLETCKQKRKQWFVRRMLYLGLGILFILLPLPFISTLWVRAIVVGCVWLFFMMFDFDAHVKICELEKNAKEMIAQANNIEDLCREQDNLLEAQAANWIAQCTKAGGLITLSSSFQCLAGEGVVFAADHVQMQNPVNDTDVWGNTTTVWNTVDVGDLILTNRRLVFVGPIVRTYP